MAAGAALNRDEVRWLEAAPNPVRLKDLTEIGKIGEDHERAQVCIALSNGEAKSASAARKAYRGVEVPRKTPLKPIFRSC
ncbi:ParB-like nuclease domain protein [Rhodovulum sp. P5]|nr:ParB-like nuclease domain protein [Rhodovulum sp. P5]